MMDDFENPIDKIIREAREKGDFDNLPGKGKPLQWDDDTLVPDEFRLANRLLKQNNFTLDWIELGQELDAAYEQARRTLEQARSARADGRLSVNEWQAFARQYIDQIKALNRQVVSYNQRVPNMQFQRNPYPIDKDMKEAGGG